jgi:hypothetical protein
VRPGGGDRESIQNFDGETAWKVPTRKTKKEMESDI